MLLVASEVTIEVAAVSQDLSKCPMVMIRIPALVERAKRTSPLWFLAHCMIIAPSHHPQPPPWGWHWNCWSILPFHVPQHLYCFSLSLHDLLVLHLTSSSSLFFWALSQTHQIYQSIYHLSCPLDHPHFTRIQTVSCPPFTGTKSQGSEGPQPPEKDQGLEGHAQRREWGDSCSPALEGTLLKHSAPH